MKTHVLPRHLALRAGCHQLINWGISFYMPGTFAQAIVADRGWSSPQLYLGLTLAMLVMAMVSPFVARLLAYAGGQNVVMSGTLLIAASCAGMAYTQTLFGWYGAWLVAGIGMRLSLYDALFAALVNLYGQQARRTISRITLADLRPLWPAECGADSHASPPAAGGPPARYRAARARGTA